MRKVLGSEETARIIEDIHMTADQTPSGYTNYRPWKSELPRGSPKFPALRFHIERLRLEQILHLHVSTRF